MSRSISNSQKPYKRSLFISHKSLERGRGRGTLGMFWWECAAGTLEPLAYTRASSAEFWYPIAILD